MSKKKEDPMSATCKEALRLLRLDFDTVEIANIMNLPENVIADAIYLARQEEKKKKCKPQPPQS